VQIHDSIKLVISEELIPEFQKVTKSDGRLDGMYVINVRVVLNQIPELFFYQKVNFHIRNLLPDGPDYR
jgi:hypothetical protein